MDLTAINNQLFLFTLPQPHLLPFPFPMDNTTLPLFNVVIPYQDFSTDPRELLYERTEPGPLLTSMLVTDPHPPLVSLAAKDVVDEVTWASLKPARVSVEYEGNEGCGVRLLEPRKKGEYAGRLDGDLVTKTRGDHRLQKYPLSRIIDMTLECRSDFPIPRLEMSLDVTKRFSYLGLCSHSCNPNLVTYVMAHDGQLHALVYTTRAIKANEYLTMSWWDFEEMEEWEKRKYFSSGCPSCPRWSVECRFNKHSV